MTACRSIEESRDTHGLAGTHREQALAEIRHLLDTHGGGIDVHQLTDVFLARAL
ncbi:hypothetical protein [Actinacidiphila oryziradicis]|uniref:hypothetical protein n=1 Tax=Actinacidiphila oryziradicis TaxID=2571141 RepID=UPI00145F95B1|nr:hypothetical protein [Actinacidiphila oryziradicis]